MNTRRLMKAYRLSAEDYQKILDNQKGRCAGCDVHHSERKLLVDHDHKTMRVRGLLCNDCNLTLGWSHDNPTLLRRLASYLSSL
jgi:hypothetical protein